jgi:Flp pilus assembly protein TadB
MSWKFFIGATILATGLLIKVGAPLVPVVMGIAMAALFNWWRERRATAKR